MGILPRAGVTGLLFDLRTLPSEFDEARGADFHPNATSWLGDIWEIAGTRIKGEPRAPFIMHPARVIHDACVSGRGRACITFAAIAKDAHCVPETVQRVVRFLERRGMIDKSRGKSVKGKSANVYRLRGLG